MMDRRSLLIAALIASGATAVPGIALAQEYPAKPIRILVPYEAGGIADLVARILGDKFTAYWGQQVVVENKPGAGGSLALETMVNDADEGHTILIGTASEVTIGPIFRPDSEGVTGSRTIAIITQSPMVLVAGASAGFTDWAGFVEAAKAAGDPLAFSSAGNGTITHITGEGVALAAGVPMLHIAYGGGSPATLAAVAGEVPLNLGTMSTALPHITDGSLHALAVTSAERYSGLPDVPTVAELTGQDFDFSIFVHLTVPADTPEEVVATLTEGVARALAEPDVQQRLTELANEPVGLYGDEAQARVEGLREKAAEIVSTANIVLE